MMQACTQVGGTQLLCNTSWPGPRRCELKHIRIVLSSTMRQHLIMTMNKSQVDGLPQIEHHEEALSGVLEAKEDCNVYGAPPAKACRQYDRRQPPKGQPSSTSSHFQELCIVGK